MATEANQTAISSNGMAVPNPLAPSTNTAAAAAAPSPSGVEVKANPSPAVQVVPNPTSQIAPAPPQAAPQAATTTAATTTATVQIKTEPVSGSPAAPATAITTAPTAAPATTITTAPAAAAAAAGTATTTTTAPAPASGTTAAPNTKANLNKMFRPPDHVTHDTDFMDFAIDLEDLFTDCYYPDVAPSNPSATAAPPVPAGLTAMAPPVPSPLPPPAAATAAAATTATATTVPQQPQPTTTTMVTTTTMTATPAVATTTVGAAAPTTTIVTANVAEKGIVVPPLPSQEKQVVDIAPTSQQPVTNATTTTLPMKRAAEEPAMVLSSSTSTNHRRTSTSTGGAGTAAPGEELTEQQKLERRERNREHAKRSRLRKKFLLESLQEQIHELQEQMEQFKSAITENIPAPRAEEIINRVCGNKEKYTPLPTPSGFGPVKTLMEPDFRLMSALSGSQQNFAISDPTIPDNPIVYVSQGFLSLTGYTLDQVLGRNCRFLQGPGTDQSAVEVIRKGIAEGVDTSVCLLNYKADGTPFWNQFFVAALRDAEDNVVNYVGVQCEVSKAIVEKHMGSDNKKRKT